MSRFGIIPTHWMAHEELSSSDKLTLAALSTFADGDGHCWPSIRAIAIRASLSERSVQYALRNLEAIGALIVEQRDGDKGGNSSNGYWITGYDLAPGRVQSLHEGGAAIARGGVQPLHPNNTNKNRPIEHASTSTTKAPAVCFANDAQQDAYLAHRTGARNPAAFDAALQALLSGMTTGKPVEASVLGLALMDMAANGEAFNASRIRGYIRKHEGAQEAAKQGTSYTPPSKRWTLSDEERAKVYAEWEAEERQKVARGVA